MDKVDSYPLQYSDAIMGTSYTIKISSMPSALNKDQLIIQIKSLLDELDAQMSSYKSDSELSRFNSDPSLQWRDVSKSFLTVLNEAKRISDLSQGAFDITIGSVVNLWGFGPNPMSQKIPNEDILAKEMKNTGSHYLQINIADGKIKKDIPNLYLDLSGIAKGYAVDQVGELLEKNGINNYMVEIGGELRLRGLNKQQKPWRIAIEKPVSEASVIQKVLTLSDISLASSGDYRNYFAVDQQRFSHTIDPRTGKPISHKLASVTLLGDTTMTADAMATAFMVLGLRKGLKIAEEQKIAALFIIKTKDGFEEKPTTAFIKKLE